MMFQLSRPTKSALFFLFSIVFLPFLGSAQGEEVNPIFKKMKFTLSDLQVVKAEMQKDEEGKQYLHKIVRERLNFNGLLSDKYLTWYEQNGTVEMDMMLFTDSDPYMQRRTEVEADIYDAEKKMMQRMIQVALKRQPNMLYPRYESMFSWLKSGERFYAKTHIDLREAMPNQFVAQIGVFEYECRASYESDRDWWNPKENKDLVALLTELLRTSVKTENKMHLSDAQKIMTSFILETESMAFSDVLFKNLKSKSDRDAQNLLIYITTDAFQHSDDCEGYREIAKKRGVAYVPSED